jgi:hypothetical protein
MEGDRRFLLALKELVLSSGHLDARYPEDHQKNAGELFWKGWSELSENSDLRDMVGERTWERDTRSLSHVDITQDGRLKKLALGNNRGKENALEGMPGRDLQGDVF